VRLQHVSGHTRAALRMFTNSTACAGGRKGNSSAPPSPDRSGNLPAFRSSIRLSMVAMPTAALRRMIARRWPAGGPACELAGAAADLRATKMLIDMLKEVEEKAGTAARTPPDREVVELFVARLRR
jgi:hypothetical protein